jgi:hypothetical protein
MDGPAQPIWRAFGGIFCKFLNIGPRIARIFRKKAIGVNGRDARTLDLGPELLAPGYLRAEFVGLLSPRWILGNHSFTFIDCPQLLSMNT